MKANKFTYENNLLLAQAIGYKSETIADMRRIIPAIYPLMDSSERLLFKHGNVGTRWLCHFNPDNNFGHMIEVVESMESQGWTIKIWGNRCLAKNQHHVILNIESTKLAATYMTCCAVAKIILNQTTNETEQNADKKIS